MKKLLLIEKRKLARQLKKKGWSNSRIARHLGSHRDSIRRWVGMDDAEVERDERGWRKGQLKKYSEEGKKRVVEIREQLEQDDKGSVGSAAIKVIYRKRFGRDISEAFINRTLKEYRDRGPSHRMARKNGARVKQPLRWLKKLGRVIMSLDFIGSKPMKGSRPRISLLCCRYSRPQKLGIVSQVSGQRGEEVIRILKFVWRSYLKPDMVVMNNNTAFGVNSPHRGCIGRVPLFLLNLGIKPFYTPSPDAWDNIDLESGLSVFSENFFRRLAFDDKQDGRYAIEQFYLVYKKKNLSRGN